MQKWKFSMNNLNLNLFLTQSYCTGCSEIFISWTFLLSHTARREAQGSVSVPWCWFSAADGAARYNSFNSGYHSTNHSLTLVLQLKTRPETERLTLKNEQKSVIASSFTSIWKEHGAARYNELNYRCTFKWTINSYSFLLFCIVSDSMICLFL